LASDFDANPVIAKSVSDEAIHLAAKMDCFASLAMTNKFPFFVLPRGIP
jgi:hypothetical protein